MRRPSSDNAFKEGSSSRPSMSSTWFLCAPSHPMTSIFVGASSTATANVGRAKVRTTANKQKVLLFMVRLSLLDYLESVTRPACLTPHLFESSRGDNGTRGEPSERYKTKSVNKRRSGLFQIDGVQGGLLSRNANNTVSSQLLQRMLPSHFLTDSIGSYRGMAVNSKPGSGTPALFRISIRRVPLSAQAFTASFVPSRSSGGVTNSPLPSVAVRAT